MNARNILSEDYKVLIKENLELIKKHLPNKGEIIKYNGNEISWCDEEWVYLKISDNRIVAQYRYGDYMPEIGAIPLDRDFKELGYAELINRYFAVGGKIVERQKKYGWGKSVVEQLSKDLQAEFPGRSGFSARNLWDMRRLYSRYVPHKNLRQAVAEIPWGHHLLILNKTTDIEEAVFYIRETARNGWSRNVLLNFIKADSYKAALKEGKQHNFSTTLPVHLAEQAEETIKSEYSLEFLGLAEPVRERELENKMIEHIRDVLLALGYGFAYMGKQYKIKLGKNEYYIDLLFYHRHLQCMIAVELKAGKFEPAHAAQLNYYLEILDDTVKRPQENPSIGILLCAEKDHLEVEYALRVSNKPIGVAEYNLTRKLPKTLKRYCRKQMNLKSYYDNYLEESN